MRPQPVVILDKRMEKHYFYNQTRESRLNTATRAKHSTAGIRTASYQIGGGFSIQGSKRSGHKADDLHLLEIKNA